MLICDIFLKEINIDGNWGAKAYCVFYGLYEVLSILENLAELELPGARAIKNILTKKIPKDIQEEIKEDKNEQD